MNFKSLFAVSSSILAMAAAGIQTARIDQQDVKRLNNTSVFAQPRLLRQVVPIVEQLKQAFETQDFKLAAELCDQGVQFQPDSPVMYYHRARAYAKLGRSVAAIHDLKRSVELGLRAHDEINKQPDFESLRSEPAWEDIIAEAKGPKLPARTIVPAKIEDGIAQIAEENTLLIGGDQFAVAFEKPDDVASETIAVGTDSIARQLNDWAAEGTAVGLGRVLYDNHDRLHSDMNWQRFPQLTRVKYSAAARAESLDNGLQLFFRYNWTTFGNSSTALVGDSFWRSQPRLAYSSPNAAVALANQYNTNHLYLYPEHKDYDPGRNGKGGFGDVYTANTPYVLLSQGSSHSDKPFMLAVASTLAAFHPDVFHQLENRGMIFSCVQMILRRCLTPIVTDQDYLSGIAHPPVFDSKQLDVKRMIEMAHQIKTSNIPPKTRLSVISEQHGKIGTDYFEAQPREVLFDTDAAIARVFRSVGRSKTIQVAATATDLNNRKQTWRWVVLQGDPDLISIEPANADSSQVSITVQHHPRRPIRPGSAMESNRVDIAAFAHNGDYFSAPAFVTYYFPDNEIRDYDAEGRIQSVQYTDFANGGNYVDPLVVTAKEWEDEYKYDSKGRLTGWIRRGNGNSRWFTSRGELVLTTDDFGRPATGTNVRYVVTQRLKHAPLLDFETTDEVLKFRYASDDDKIGQIVN